MRRLLGLLLAAVLALVALVACEPPPTDVSGQFNIDANGLIHSPNGAVFTPVGANVGTQGSFDWSGDALGHSASAVAWGWNTIRLDLYTVEHAPPGTERSRAQQIINEYTAKGIVVIVGSWWCENTPQGNPNGGSYSNPTTPENCPDPFSWMRALAAANNTNPYVWFECVNEPIADGQDWVRLQHACLDSVRGVWNNNLVVATAPGAAADIGWSGCCRLYDGLGQDVLAKNNRVVFSQHNYGGYCDAASEGQYLDRMHAAGLAVIIGEFGFFYPNTGQWYDCALANMAAAPSRHVGLLVWNGTMADGFWLRTQSQPFYGTAPLTDLGQRFWNLTH